MALEVLATSDQYGSGVTIELSWGLASAIWQAITRKDLSGLAQYANSVIQQVEEAQPEGTPMQLEIQGLGDYASSIADWLNTKWQEGYLVEPSGAPLVPWPEYPNQIAWGENGTLTLRWVKMFVWAAILIVVAFVVAIIVYAAAPYITGWTRWVLSRVPPPPQKEEGGTWWDRLSPIEKAAIIGGGTVALAFVLWFMVQQRVAEAGAPKITIVTGGE